MVTILRDDGAEIYETKGGITVTRQRRPTPYADAVSSYIDKLDERRGTVFSSTTNTQAAIRVGIQPSSIRRSVFPAMDAMSGSKPITSAARLSSASSRRS